MERQRSNSRYRGGHLCLRLPETRNGSSPTIFLKLPPPQFASRQRYAGRSSSFIANGNKPPEFNVANAENKEPNAITSRPHYWLGPIFIKQQCGPKQRSTPSSRDYWMTTFANSSGIQLLQLLLRKSYPINFSCKYIVFFSDFERVCPIFQL